MGYNTSTNMNLPIPQVGNEAGPQYAVDVNNCLTLVDQHDHSPGYGVKITPSGININQDFDQQSNNIINPRSVRFASQSAVLVGVSDLDCAYVVLNDLYYNDGLGNNIRLTQNGAIAGTPGSISNLVPPASAAYSVSLDTFIFQSGANIPANIDGAAFTLRNLLVNSNGLTLEPPASLVSDYTIVLPSLPASTLPVSISATGVMSAALITAAQLSPSVQSAIIPPGTISMFGGSSAPTGFLLCDGSAVSRTTYSALFSAISTAYGSGDGSTTFILPDLRGLFPRGVSGASTNDPDKLTRTAQSSGGNTGNNVGSVQADDYLAHTHTIQSLGNGSGGGNGANFGGGSNLQPSATNTSPQSDGLETRPKNVYVNFIIKI